MKLKKLLSVLAGMALVGTLFSGSAFATDWAVCTPAQIGPKGDIVRIQLTKCNINPAGTKKGWMTLQKAGSDQMMAVILTAMSLNKPIGVEFGTGTDSGGYNWAYSVILNMN